MTAVPKWAAALVADVCEQHGIVEPAVTWRRGRTSALSSGTYYRESHRLVVTAAGPRHEQRLVLLHELAHALIPGEHHSLTFWLTAWRLYFEHGVPVRHAQRREFGYRQTARRAYEIVRAERRRAA